MRKYLNLVRSTTVLFSVQFEQHAGILGRQPRLLGLAQERFHSFRVGDHTRFVILQIYPVLNEVASQAGRPAFTNMLRRLREYQEGSIFDSGQLNPESGHGL